MGTVEESITENCCAWTEGTPAGCNSPEDCCSTQTHPIAAENPIVQVDVRPDRNNQCSNIGQPVPEDASVTGTGQYVQEFADDQSAWMTVFLEAWHKATSNGFVPPEF